MKKFQTYNLDETEIGYKLQKHACNLSKAIQTLDIFTCCLEEELYVNTKTELYSFIQIILEYLKQVKSDFNNIEDELGIS